MKLTNTTLKKIILEVLKEEEPKKSSHYEGWFWDFDTKSFKRWEDLKFNG